MRQREPSFMDARPIDDPLRIESVSFPQILIGHDPFGDIAARAEDLHTQEAIEQPVRDGFDRWS